MINIPQLFIKRCDLNIEGTISDSLLSHILGSDYRVVDLTKVDMSSTDYQTTGALLSCTGGVVKATKRKNNIFLSLLKRLTAELVILPDEIQSRYLKFIRENPHIFQIYVNPTSHNLYMDGDLVRSKSTKKVLFDPSTRIIPEDAYKVFLELHYMKDRAKREASYEIADKLFSRYRSSFFFPRICYNEEGKMGVKDCTGKTIIEPVYDDVSFITTRNEPFPNIIECKEKSTLYLFNNLGELFTDAEETWPDWYTTEIFLFKKDSKWGCVYAPDKLLPAIYDCITDGPGYLKIKQNGLWGLLDFDRYNKVTYYSPQFDGIYDDNYSNEAVYVNGKRLKLADFKPEATDPFISIRR